MPSPAVVSKTTEDILNFSYDTIRRMAEISIVCGTPKADFTTIIKKYDSLDSLYEIRSADLRNLLCYDILALMRQEFSNTIIDPIDGSNSGARSRECYFDHKFIDNMLKHVGHLNKLYGVPKIDFANTVEDAYRMAICVVHREDLRTLHNGLAILMRLLYRKLVKFAGPIKAHSEPAGGFLTSPLGAALRYGLVAMGVAGLFYANHIVGPWGPV